jgi:hypothetical protein
MPPHAERVSVVTTDAWAYAVVGRQVRRKGHFKVPGVEIGRAAWKVPTVGVNTSRANPWLELVRADVDAQTSCRKRHAGASHATPIVSTARRRALESAASNFPLWAY